MVAAISSAPTRIHAYFREVLFSTIPRLFPLGSNDLIRPVFIVVIGSDGTFGTFSLVPASVRPRKLTTRLTSLQRYCAQKSVLQSSGFFAGRGSAWLERVVRDHEVGGSNPLAPMKAARFGYILKRVVLFLEFASLIAGSVVTLSDVYALQRSLPFPVFHRIPVQHCNQNGLSLRVARHVDHPVDVNLSFVFNHRLLTINDSLVNSRILS